MFVCMHAKHIYEYLYAYMYVYICVNMWWSRLAESCEWRCPRTINKIDMHKHVYELNMYSGVQRNIIFKMFIASNNYFSAKKHFQKLIYPVCFLYPHQGILSLPRSL